MTGRHHWNVRNFGSQAPVKVRLVSVAVNGIEIPFLHFLSQALHNPDLESVRMFKGNDLAVPQVVLQSKDVFFPSAIPDMPDITFNADGRKLFCERGHNRLRPVKAGTTDKLQDSHGLNSDRQYDKMLTRTSSEQEERNETL